MDDLGRVKTDTQIDSVSVKVQTAISLLQLLASDVALPESISVDSLNRAISGLASLAPDPEDEYRPSEEQSNEVTDLQSEVAALREVNESREKIFLGRIDNLQEEIAALRLDRARLCESAVGLEEAVRAREVALRLNSELEEANARIVSENGRLRQTNNALTLQLFTQGESEKTLFSSESPTVESEVMDLLTGRKEETHEGLLKLVAKLYQKSEDDKLNSERQQELLHARIRELEGSQLTRTFSPNSPRNISAELRNTVASLSSGVASFFQ